MDTKILLWILFALSALKVNQLNRVKIRGNIKKKRRTRTIWVREWLLKRDEMGAYNNIVEQLRLSDEFEYRKYFRMNEDSFKVNLIAIFSNLFFLTTTGCGILFV